ncbi:ChrR family anti-sigma-E factor [Reyranella sp.]|uniref:ChrR family anti-sigma-E factor n=1 Tax=Reyranella sp. TaxID=1929291 RepID=UPI003D0D4DCC
MSRHPAPDELLLDYAAGVLPEGPALAVALHVAIDPASRRVVERLRDVGAALIEGEATTGDLGDAALEQALARLDGVPVEAPRVPAAALRQSGVARPGFDWAPAPLRPYLAGKAWKRMFGGFDEIRIGLRDGTHRVSLLRLEPGKGLPVHRHVAAEFTIVLQGGYTDNTGNYGVGDFAVGPGPQEHEPIADPGEPCIALIVVEKPIVLTGVWGRLLNPLVRWGWM